MRMKLLLFVLMVVGMMGSVSASYTTFVTLHVTAMDCAACSGDLTGVSWDSGSLAVYSDTCNTVVGSSAVAMDAMVENGYYTTASVELTGSTGYNLCFKAYPKYMNGGFSVGHDLCASSSNTNECYVALAGATCDSQDHMRIGLDGSPNSQGACNSQVSTYTFPFTA